MARRASPRKKFPSETRDALAVYLAELEKVYPEGTNQCQVVPWPEYGEGSSVVKISPLEDEEKWIALSGHLAEVGTRILIQSEQFFILTMSSLP